MNVIFKNDKEGMNHLVEKWGFEINTIYEATFIPEGAGEYGDQYNMTASNDQIHTEHFWTMEQLAHLACSGYFDLPKNVSKHESNA